MALTPPSSRPEFQDVDTLYQRELAPLLNEGEMKRRAAVRDAAVIAAIAAACIGGFVSIGGDAGMIGAVVSGMVGLGIAGARINRARGEITHQVLARVADHLGFSYRRALSRPPYCSLFQDFGLLPSFNRESWEDELSGERAGAAFTLVEAHLKYRSSGKNKQTRTVFHGQLIVIDYHRKFSGETIIKRDAGLFNALAKPGKQFQRVGLASLKFEKAFEAWSTDQVEARALLDPVMLERFEELDRMFDGAKLRAAFSAGKLYVALEVGDKLDIGAMFQSIDGPQRVAKILKEIDLVFDLMDVATKSPIGRLDGAFSVEDVRLS
jgi:hypothetical protein